MFRALLQSMANFGFDLENITAVYNELLATIRGGDFTSLRGVADFFSGVVAAVTGVSDMDVANLFSALVASVIEVLANSDTSRIVSAITGA